MNWQLWRSALLFAAIAYPVAASSAEPTRPASSGATCPAVLDHTFVSLQDESPLPLCRFAGKVVLIVNTASFCGFTHQYEGLERLYERYRARGLVVVGFPANDFGNQEPGSNAEIAEFCRTTYGIRFPMVARQVVSGTGAHPLFAHLAQMTGEVPRWNFHKYVIARDGARALSFPSRVEPESPELIGAIERMLAAQP